jgi:hypothetical protein
MSYVYEQGCILLVLDFTLLAFERKQSEMRINNSFSKISTILFYNLSSQ